MGINLDLLTTADIRDVLKTRAHLLRVGVPVEYAAVETLTIIIEHYRQKVGLKVYLSQMLGEMSEVPIKDCRLYWASGERIETPKSEQPIQRFLRRFGSGALPFKVVCGEEVKYL